MATLSDPSANVNFLAARFNLDLRYVIGLLEFLPGSDYLLTGNTCLNRYGNVYQTRLSKFLSFSLYTHLSVSSGLPTSLRLGFPELG